MTKTAVSYTRCPSVPTISAVAHGLGMFEHAFDHETDLDFEYKIAGFSPKVDYGHDDRYWIRNAGHAPAVWKRSKGVDCKVIGLAFLEGSYPVLSLRRSGIESVAALRGKRLGVLRRKGGNFDLMVNQQLKIYQTTLSTAGLTLDDVTVIYIDQQPTPSTASDDNFIVRTFRAAMQALEEGAVDAVTATIPPYAGDIPAINVLYDTRLHADPLARVHPSVLRGLVVSGPFLEERRDVVVQILATLLDAADHALANPLQALRIVASDLNQPPEVLASSYENLAQGVQLDLDRDRVEALSVQKAFLLQHGLIENDFDLASWVDPTPLEEARRLRLKQAA